MTYTPETDAPASILAVAMRVALLDAAGATPAGPDSMYVTDALVQFQWQPTIENGLDLMQRKGNGDLCVFTKTPDITKRYEVTLNLCTPDPELVQLLAGGVLLETSSTAVGYGAPLLGQDPTPNGVSVEIWSEAITGDVPAADNPYFWWAFPKVKFEKMEQTTLEAGIKATSYSGYMYENPGWGDGPNNDWTWNSDRAFQWVRSDSFPTPAIGVQAIPAQV